MNNQNYQGNRTMQAPMNQSAAPAKRGHLSGFDPTRHVEPVKDRATGEFRFRPKVRNNAVCMTDPDREGRQHIIEEPELKLPMDTYLEWFYCEYPNGSVQVTTEFPDAKVVSETKRYKKPDGTIEETVTENVVQPTGFATVTFYRSLEEKHAGVSLTSYRYPMEARKETDLGDPATLAIGIACRQALRFAGLGVDIPWDSLVDGLPSYFKKERVGAQVPSGTVPGGIYEGGAPAPKAADPSPNVAPPPTTWDAATDAAQQSALASLDEAFGASSPKEEKPAKKKAKKDQEDAGESAPDKAVAKEEKEEENEEGEAQAPKTGEMIFRVSESASDAMKALDGMTIAEVVRTTPAAVAAIKKPTFTKSYLKEGVREALLEYLSLQE